MALDSIATTIPSSSSLKVKGGDYRRVADQTEETTRRRELVASVLREPPAPYFSHHQLALKLARELSDYVEQRDLGVVAVAPVDVVVDREKNIVLQRDVLFVAANRLSIIKDQVWGPPDLVVEVHSESTRLYDRGEKLRLSVPIGSYCSSPATASSSRGAPRDVTGDRTQLACRQRSGARPRLSRRALWETFFGTCNTPGAG